MCKNVFREVEFVGWNVRHRVGRVRRTVVTNKEDRLNLPIIPNGGDVQENKTKRAAPFHDALGLPLLQLAN